MLAFLPSPNASVNLQNQLGRNFRQGEVHKEVFLCQMGNVPIIKCLYIGNVSLNTTL